MNDFFAEIRSYAHSSKEEVCGFLLADGEGSMVAYPAKNIAEDPVNNFEVGEEEQLAAYMTGRLVAVYHSHVNCDESFTDADRASSQATKYPFFLYSTQTGKFNYYRSPLQIPPYEGRSFLLSVQDCLSLVFDYYQKEFSFEFPFVFRTSLELRNGLKDALGSLALLGFERIEPPLTKGDIVLISVQHNGIANHAGVYVGDGIILHQLMGRMSCCQRYTSAWETRCTGAYRKFTSKVQ